MREQRLNLLQFRRAVCVRFENIGEPIIQLRAEDDAVMGFRC